VSCTCWTDHPTFGFSACASCNFPKRDHFFPPMSANLHHTADNVMVRKQKKATGLGSWKKRSLTLRDNMLTWRKSTAQQDAEHRVTISLDMELLCIVSSDGPTTTTTTTTASAIGVAPEQGGALRLSGSGSGATDVSLAVAAPAPPASSKGDGWIFAIRSADNAGGGESETHTFMVSTEDERSQWLTILLEAKTFVYNAHKARIAEAESLLSLSQVNTLAAPNPESAGIAPMNGPTDEPTGPSVSMRVSDPLAAEKLAALKAMLSPQTPAIVTTTDDEEVAKLTVLAEKLETNEAALEKFVSPPSGRRGGIHLLQRMLERVNGSALQSTRDLSTTLTVLRCLHAIARSETGRTVLLRQVHAMPDSDHRNKL